jgi:sulfide:quinone oxidoreductase
MARDNPKVLPRIVILGGGLGGVTAAFAIADELGTRAELHLVSDLPRFSFTPSNPWVAVHWRDPEEIQVELGPSLARRKIAFTAQAVEKVEPAQNRLVLEGGTTLTYDYLVIATGPALAFDEVPGLGPDGGYTQSICTTAHAQLAADAFDEFVQKPGPIIVGAAPGASCFGPAYEFAMILDTELRRRKIRDRVPMTFVTPEPYLGHLGLDGVGDTKSLLESEFRDRHVKWIVSARITDVDEASMHAEEVSESGKVTKQHDIPFSYAMVLPAFRGIGAVNGVEGLVNPRGFVIVDDYQRNPKYRNVFALGVCVAIPPVGETPIPVGVPKTGFMIETMATAIARNICALVDGREADAEATWNAICLADFGDGGVAFVAQPQIPPRNVNWSAEGKWVHYAKIAFEKYFLRKVRKGIGQPFYERFALEVLGMDALRNTAPKESERAK